MNNKTINRPTTPANLEYRDETYEEYVRRNLAEAKADVRPTVSHEKAMARIQAVIDAKRRKNA